MDIQHIARAVTDVSIYSEQTVRDFFDERNHLGQATVGVVVAEVLMAALDSTEVRLSTQTRLAVNCWRGKASLDEAYQLLREATGLDDCERYLAKASNLARTLALRDGIVLSRSELWLSTEPNDAKYWEIASISMAQISGIPVDKMLAESRELAGSA